MAMEFLKWILKIQLQSLKYFFNEPVAAACITAKNSNKARTVRNELFTRLEKGKWDQRFNFRFNSESYLIQKNSFPFRSYVLLGVMTFSFVL